MATTSNSNNGGADNKAQEQSKFPVYMLHSHWSLSQMDTFLAGYGDVGFLRIVYDNEGKETDRTIAILPDAVYDGLCKDGYDRRQYGRGIKVSEFLLNESNYPGEGRTKTLFVPVPKNLGSDDGQVIAAVVGKLEHLAEWGIVPSGSWSVNVPLKSREKGGVRSGCFISFKREVSLDAIAMTRVLLTDTYWPEVDEAGERPVFRCFWARDRKEHKDNGEKSERKGKGKNEAPSEEEKQAKEEKKKKAIQKVVKKAKPVAKASTTPVVPVVEQPTLKGEAKQEVAEN